MESFCAFSKGRWAVSWRNSVWDLCRWRGTIRKGGYVLPGLFRGWLYSWCNLTGNGHGEEWALQMIAAGPSTEPRPVRRPAWDDEEASWGCEEPVSRLVSRLCISSSTGIRDGYHGLATYRLLTNGTRGYLSDIVKQWLEAVD